MSKRKMRKDKYNKVKPKVSPITFIMVGLFIFAIIFTTIMLIDTPKQKLYKTFRRGALQTNQELDLKKNHDYKAISLKQLEKLIEKGEDIVVFIGTSNSPTATQAINEIQHAFDREGNYKEADDYNNKVSDYVKVIYYLELDTYEEGYGLDGLNAFYTKYEINGAGIIPDLIAFSDSEVIKHYEISSLPNISEYNKLVRSISDFFNKASIEFAAK